MNVPFTGVNSRWDGVAAHMNSNAEKYKNLQHGVAKNIKIQADRILDNSTWASEIQKVSEYAKLNACSIECAFNVVFKNVGPPAWKEFYPRLPLLAANRRSFAYMQFVLHNYCNLRCALDGIARARDDTLFNRISDMDYVLYLVVADGIVSLDNGMLEVAKAFFPNRLTLRGIG